MFVLRLEIPSVLPTAHSVPVCHHDTLSWMPDGGWDRMVEPLHPIVLATAIFSQRLVIPRDVNGPIWAQPQWMVCYVLQLSLPSLDNQSLHVRSRGVWGSCAFKSVCATAVNLAQKQKMGKTIINDTEWYNQSQWERMFTNVFLNVYSEQSYLKF